MAQFFMSVCPLGHVSMDTMPMDDSKKADYSKWISDDRMASDITLNTTPYSLKVLQNQFNRT